MNTILIGNSSKPKCFGGAEAISGNKKLKWDAFQTLASSNERPIKPERIVATLRKILDDDAIIVADPGTPCPYLSAYYEIRTSGRTLFSNRAHGALGYSLSAAMGAYIGRPDKKIIAVMGDGSFGFTCGELETVVRKKMPITFIVISNAEYGWIKAGQKSSFQERYFAVEFSRTDHAAVARAFGIKSYTVEDPETLELTLRAAINHSGPNLIDIISQPLHEAAAPVSEWIA